MNQAVFDPETLDLDPMLKRLHLANTRRQWQQFCQQAENEQWSPRKLLAVVFAEEIAQRKNTRINREVRRAGFPFLKTIDDFDFTLQSTLRLALLGSYLGPELVAEGRCLVLTGKTGRGKTHVAVAIAYRAIQNGFTARFITAKELIDDLSDPGRKGDFREALATYTQPHLLVVDEVGYLGYGPDAANVLFHVVNTRHTQRRPMVFTTNKSPFTEWGAALHDRDLAEAIVDRILERGRLIVLDGPSYRTRHLDGLDRGPLPGSNEPARISGIGLPEYPEPPRGRPVQIDRCRMLQRQHGRCISWLNAATTSASDDKGASSVAGPRRISSRSPDPAVPSGNSSARARSSTKPPASLPAARRSRRRHA